MTDRKEVKQIVVNSKTYDVIGTHFNCNFTRVVYIVNEKFEDGHFKWFSTWEKLVYEM